MNASSQIADRVRRFIIDNYLYMRPDASVGDDDRLLATGIVDSMGVVEIVAFLEEEFGVVVPDEEVTEDNLGSVRSIAAFVAGRAAGAGTVPS
jgi:acyl carrier protein